MNPNQLFVAIEVPYSLSKEELYNDFKKMKTGDWNARQEIITHHIRLVINEVLKKYSWVSSDKEELIAIGMVGLIKSVDTFQPAKNASFCTYAISCIRNEIITFFRKNRKYYQLQIANSMIDESGNEISYLDRVADETIDFVKEYEQKECYQRLRSLLAELPSRKQEIMMSYFGIDPYLKMSQKELAKHFQVSQSWVSKTIQIILEQMRKTLQSEGMIEVSKQRKHVR